METLALALELARRRSQRIRRKRTAERNSPVASTLELDQMHKLQRRERNSTCSLSRSATISLYLSLSASVCFALSCKQTRSSVSHWQLERVFVWRASRGRLRFVLVFEAALASSERAARLRLGLPAWLCLQLWRHRFDTSNWQWAARRSR